VYTERSAPGFTVLAVNIQEAKEPVSIFLNKYGISFPVLMDLKGEVTQLYGVYGLPSTYFVDREGKVAQVHVGPLNKAAIAQRVDRLLE
jgi:peroxiredoxin